MARRKKGPLSTTNARWNAIKKHVTFRFDGRRNLSKTASSSDKQKIKRYFDEINDLTAQPNVTKHFRRSDHFKAAAGIVGQNTRLRALKTVFVPYDGVNIPKVKFRRKTGKIIAITQTQHVTETTLDFNKKAMVTNPDQEVMRVASIVPEANRFIIRAGKFTIPGTIARRSLPGAVTKLQNAYSRRKNNPELLNNGKLTSHHEWDKWLDGLIAAEFQDQDSREQYSRNVERAKKLLRKKRRAARVKTKRQIKRRKR